MANFQRRAQAIFDRALEFDSTNQRANYLDQTCGSDSKLRAEVESLIAALEKEGSFQQSTYDETVGQISLETQSKIGAEIGPYRLEEKIGEGGFGLVYRAEQQQLNRQVAIKLLKPGMDTREVLNRFEAERQALAVMDHSGIASVLDAGTTESGHPYFVMELVRGDSVTIYSDRNRLMLEQRLRLFIRICSAVQHAHQKGVIHRDIKPANVLVVEQDGQAIPKVIDFGIAKAIDQRLTSDSIHTQWGQLIGTPIYMSPEQADLGNLDIDARSDIYSLGILLYELLTGSPPISRQKAKSVGVEEVLRMVRESETPRPSRRLNESQSADSTVAERRRSQPLQLERTVQGDLDWIVMKALAKDRSHRYESASGLARDIERFLSNDPVDATPPSASYRFKKFIRKHRTAVLISMAFVTVLLSATTISAWQAVRATRNATKAFEAVAAESKAKEAEKAQRILAQKATETATLALESESLALASETEKRKAFEALWGFMENTLRSPQPGLDGRKITVAELLDRKSVDLKNAFLDDSKTRATMLLAIGETYEGLGLQRNATPLFVESKKIRSHVYGADSPEMVEVILVLTNNYIDCGLYDEALEEANEVKGILDSQVGKNSGGIESRISCMLMFSDIYLQTGQLDRSIELSQSALDLAQSTHGVEHETTLVAMESHATVCSGLGQYKESLRLRMKSYEVATKLFEPDSFRIINALGGLAGAYAKNGNPKKSLELNAKAAELAKTKYGDEHGTYADFLNGYALSLARFGQFKEAVPLYEKVVSIIENRFGDDFPRLCVYRINLSFALDGSGNRPKALAVLEDGVKRAKRSLGQDHPNTLRIVNSLADMYSKMGQLQKSIELLEANVAIADKRFGESNSTTLLYRTNLAICYEGAKRVEEAIAMLEKTYPAYVESWGNDHPNVLNSKFNLGRLYAETGRIEQGAKLVEECLETANKSLGESHPMTSLITESLAAIYTSVGRTEESAELNHRVLQAMKERVAINGHADLNAVFELAMAYQASGDIENAMASFTKVMDCPKPVSRADQFTIYKSMNSVGVIHYSAGQFDQANELFEALVKLSEPDQSLDESSKLLYLKHLAHCKRQMKQFEKAVEMYEEIAERLKEVPKSENTITRLYWDLGFVYLEVSKDELALKTLERYVAADRIKLKAHPGQMANVLARIGPPLLAHRLWRAAEGYLQECCKLRKQAEPNSWWLFEHMGMLGAAQVGIAVEEFSKDRTSAIEWLVKAEKNLVEGYEGQSHRPKGVHPQKFQAKLIFAAKHLIKLYDLWGKPKEAATWKKRLAELTDEQIPSD